VAVIVISLAQVLCMWSLWMRPILLPGRTTAEVAVALAVSAISLAQVLCMWSLWMQSIPLA